MKDLIIAYDENNAYITKDEDGNELQEKDYYYDEVLDNMLWDDAVYEANKILGLKDYVEVSGTIRRWNGDREVRRIIPENTIDDIISKYIEPDKLFMEVYNDKVEFINCHHDGTNSYTLIPFNVEDFTIKELKSLFDKYDIEDFNDYSDEFHSFSQARKYELVEYVENYELFLEE